MGQFFVFVFVWLFEPFFLFTTPGLKTPGLGGCGGAGAEGGAHPRPRHPAVGVDLAQPPKACPF